MAKENDIFIDQITKEIPGANSTLSQVLVQERSTTFQNDKEDAHRLPFL